jgi:uncharacterized SAM-binding protein YcdF (DUF218 family)
MAGAWPGAAPLVRDTAARRTADSAATAAALARSRGSDTVVLVTSWWHVPRAWLLFRAVIGRAARVRAVAAGGPWRAWDVGREVAAALVVPVQAALARRRASATLERAPT